MFDMTQSEEPWDDMPDWEAFFATWMDYLSNCAKFYGLIIVNKKLVLPEGQNKALLTMATIKVLEAKSVLHELYPGHETIINQLPY